MTVAYIKLNTARYLAAKATSRRSCSLQILRQRWHPDNLGHLHILEYWEFTKYISVSIYFDKYSRYLYDTVGILPKYKQYKCYYNSFEFMKKKKKH